MKCFISLTICACIMLAVIVVFCSCGDDDAKTTEPTTAYSGETTAPAGNAGGTETTPKGNSESINGNNDVADEDTSNTQKERPSDAEVKETQKQNGNPGYDNSKDQNINPLD